MQVNIVSSRLHLVVHVFFNSCENLKIHLWLAFLRTSIIYSKRSFEEVKINSNKPTKQHKPFLMSKSGLPAKVYTLISNLLFVRKHGGETRVMPFTEQEYPSQSKSSTLHYHPFPQHIHTQTHSHHHHDHRPFYSWQYNEGAIVIMTVAAAVC